MILPAIIAAGNCELIGAGTIADGAVVLVWVCRRRKILPAIMGAINDKEFIVDENEKCFEFHVSTKLQIFNFSLPHIHSLTRSLSSSRSLS